MTSIEIESLNRLGAVQELRVNGHETLGLAVDFLFVFGPKLVPYHIHNIPGRALSTHEAAQCGHINTTSHNTANRREARIVPSRHVSVIGKPRQFSLGQDRVFKIDS